MTFHSRRAEGALCVKLNYVFSIFCYFIIFSSLFYFDNSVFIQCGYVHHRHVWCNFHTNCHIFAMVQWF